MWRSRRELHCTICGRQKIDRSLRTVKDDVDFIFIELSYIDRIWLAEWLRMPWKPR